MADRYFTPSPIRPGRITLSGDEAKHLVRVARRQVGDVVEIFDGRGNGALAKVLSTERDAVVLEVGNPVPDRDPDLSLTLAVAVPKGERFDWLVEKATELGVARLVPLRAERSVVDPRSAKLDRLRRVIVEASKQCGRNRLMILDEPRTLRDYLENEPSNRRFLANQGGMEIRQWPPTGPDRTTALAIGPEGGWTAAEVDQATALGWIPAGLGTTRLRVETAAIAGAAVLFAFSQGGQEPCGS